MPIVDRLDILEVFELLIKFFDLLILLSPKVVMNQFNLMFNPDAILYVFFNSLIYFQDDIASLTFPNIFFK